jgi:hypothetical protein
VRHLAVPARSVHSQRPYTCAGLGDRIHTVTLGWVLQEPTTLHLTADKMAGGQFGNKPESWAEIVALFPKGSVSVCPHLIMPGSESEWLRYLGNGVESYSYYDYPGQFEQRAALDISQYLKRIPPLTAEPQDIELPERFVTVQWDAGGKSRTIPEEPRRRVLERYGCPAVVVGGEATDERLRCSMKHIAYAMSRAELHVGVDSAFMHMAQLYMRPERIHLYGHGQSHHLKRAVDNGAKLNLYL